MNTLVNLFVRAFARLVMSPQELSEKELGKTGGFYKALIEAKGFLEADQFASLPQKLRRLFCDLMVSTKPLTENRVKYDSRGNLAAILENYSPFDLTKVLEGFGTLHERGMEKLLSAVEYDLVSLFEAAGSADNEKFLALRNEGEFKEAVREMKRDWDGVRLSESEETTRADEFMFALASNYPAVFHHLRDELKELFPDIDEFDAGMFPSPDDTEFDDEDDFDYIEYEGETDWVEQDYEEEPDDEEEPEEGKGARGRRDGTGPYAGSYQAQTAGVGKRKAAGEPCPAEQDDEEEPDDEMEPDETDSGDMPMDGDEPDDEEEGCATPGMRIRSGGRGRGMARGGGRGPMGRPYGEQDEEPDDEMPDDEEEEESNVHYMTRGQRLSQEGADKPADYYKELGRSNDPKTGKPFPRPVEQDDEEDDEEDDMEESTILKLKVLKDSTRFSPDPEDPRNVYWQAGGLNDPASGKPFPREQDEEPEDMPGSEAEPEEPMEVPEELLVMSDEDLTALEEKWGTKTTVNPKEKGKYKDSTASELRKRYASLKAKGPYKEGSKEYGLMKELAFAIRAKTGWGKVAASVGGKPVKPLSEKVRALTIRFPTPDEAADFADHVADDYGDVVQQTARATVVVSTEFGTEPVDLADVETIARQYGGKIIRREAASVLPSAGTSRLVEKMRKITQGMMNAMGRRVTARYRCEECGMVVPVYAGRYPAACPNCGTPFEVRTEKKEKVDEAKLIRAEYYVSFSPVDFRKMFAWLKDNKPKFMSEDEWEDYEADGFDNLLGDFADAAGFKGMYDTDTTGTGNSDVLVVQGGSDMGRLKKTMTLAGIKHNIREAKQTPLREAKVVNKIYHIKFPVPDQRKMFQYLKQKGLRQADKYEEVDRELLIRDFLDAMRLRDVEVVELFGAHEETFAVPAKSLPKLNKALARIGITGSIREAKQSPLREGAKKRAKHLDEAYKRLACPKCSKPLGEAFKKSLEEFETQKGTVTVLIDPLELPEETDATSLTNILQKKETDAIVSVDLNDEGYVMVTCKDDKAYGEVEELLKAMAIGESALKKVKGLVKQISALSEAKFGARYDSHIVDQGTGDWWEVYISDKDLKKYFGKDYAKYTRASVIADEAGIDYEGGSGTNTFDIENRSDLNKFLKWLKKAGIQVPVVKESVYTSSPALVEQIPSTDAAGAQAADPNAAPATEPPPAAAPTPSQDGDKTEPEQPKEVPGEEEGGEETFACPSCGAQIPKPQLKMMLGKLLHQVAAQLEQGAKEEEGGEETGPEEAPKAAEPKGEETPPEPAPSQAPPAAPAEQPKGQEQPTGESIEEAKAVKFYVQLKGKNIAALRDFIQDDMGITFVGSGMMSRNLGYLEVAPSAKQDLFLWLSEEGYAFVHESITEQSTGESIEEMARPISTANPTYGFDGSLRSLARSKRDRQKIWDAMFVAYSMVMPKATSEEIQTYLDSTRGRHMGDALTDAAYAQAEIDGRTDFNTDDVMAAIPVLVKGMGQYRDRSGTGRDFKDAVMRMRDPSDDAWYVGESRESPSKDRGEDQVQKFQPLIGELLVPADDIPEKTEIRIVDRVKEDAVIEFKNILHTVPAKDVLVFGEEASLAACLRAVQEGKMSITDAARNRLRCRKESKRLTDLPESKVASDSALMVAYFPNRKAYKTALTELKKQMSVGEFEETTSLYLYPKDDTARTFAVKVTEDNGGHIIQSRVAFGYDPSRSISEQIGADDENADVVQSVNQSFTNAYTNLKQIRQIMVDAQANMLKAVAMLQGANIGKKTQGAVQKLTGKMDIEKTVQELTKKITELNKAHDVFLAEFPDAKSEIPKGEEPEGGAPSEEPPPEGTPAPQPAPAPAEPAPAPAPEGEPQAAPQPAPAPAESVIETAVASLKENEEAIRLIEGLFQSAEPYGTIARVVRDECPELTPVQIQAVVHRLI